MKYRPKLNLLVAYPYCNKGIIEIIKTVEGDCRFLLDSGAFTAHMTGKKITLDEYCRFIETLPIKPWRYFTLDVIGDPDATLKNYQRMLDRGFHPVPILTRGEDFSVLDDFWKTSDVVGIGGLVGGGPKKNLHFIYDVMKHAQGRRVHLLGFTNEKYIKHFRPYMCDSSSWTSAHRYGRVNIYLGGGKVKTLQRTDFAHKLPRQIFEAIVRLGMDPRLMAQEKSWRGGAALASDMSARSYVEKSCDYERVIGVKLFLACARKEDVAAVCNAINRKVSQYENDPSCSA